MNRIIHNIIRIWVTCVTKLYWHSIRLAKRLPENCHDDEEYELLVQPNDILYTRAVKLIRRSNSPSIMAIKNGLEIGFNRACTLMERMEREGIISTPDVYGKRRLLS